MTHLNRFCVTSLTALSFAVPLACSLDTDGSPGSDESVAVTTQRVTQMDPCQQQLMQCLFGCRTAIYRVECERGCNLQNVACGAEFGNGPDACDDHPDLPECRAVHCLEFPNAPECAHDAGTSDSGQSGTLPPSGPSSGGGAPPSKPPQMNAPEDPGGGGGTCIESCWTEDDPEGMIIVCNRC